ncbi:xylulokinase [soil metagenome]
MTRDVVLGFDSSTQSTKVVAMSVDTGEVLGIGRAPHTGEDTQNPLDWVEALVQATAEAVTTEMRVLGLAVAAQQHGLVTIDSGGKPVRPASLWNNTDAAVDAERLNSEADFARLVGSRLVASFTIAKLAWLGRVHPNELTRTAKVCLPHDWLNFVLTGNMVTDRGDASGSGWWSPLLNRHMPELIDLAIGEANRLRIEFPRVLGPDALAGKLKPGLAQGLGLLAGTPVAAGTGDNMAAALGVGATPEELVVSLGTSGTAFGLSLHATTEQSGMVAGFADATGHYLPLVCMLNCTKVVDSVAKLAGLDTVEALDLAERSPPGAEGLMLVPYFGGERTPNLPGATGSLLGVRYGNLTRDLVVRAAVDGVSAGLAACVEGLESQGLQARSLSLVGGGSRHPTWQQSIADATGKVVEVLGGVEHVARGAAIQAAAMVRQEPVADVVRLWRPETLADQRPRPEYRDAFRLEERRLLWADR